MSVITAREREERKRRKIQIFSLIVSILLVPISAYVSSYFSIGVFQRSMQQEERVFSFIHQTYFLDGLHRIESKISTYGTAVTYALMDTRREVFSLQNDTELLDKLEMRLDEIRKREYVSDLIEKDVGFSEYLPRLITFGLPLHGAIKNTFYIYGRLVDDTTDFDNLKRQMDDLELLLGDHTGLEATRLIVEHMQLYLEKRLRELENFVFEKTLHYRSIYEFLQVNEDILFQKFIQEVEEYNGKISAWMSAMTSGSVDDLRTTSSVLGEWLQEHIQTNPFAS